MLESNREKRKALQAQQAKEEAERQRKLDLSNLDTKGLTSKEVQALIDEATKAK